MISSFPKHLTGHFTTAALIALVLSGCSQPAAVPAAKRQPLEVPPSEADMRAARLLSLSDNSSLDAKSDPYERAVTCVVSIDALSTKLASTAAITSQQKGALLAARSIYDRKAQEAGHKSAADVAREVRDAPADPDGLKQRLLTALSCIRQIS